MPHLNNAAWSKSRMQVKFLEIVSLPNFRIQRSFKANDDDLEHLGTTIGSTKAIIVVAGIFWNKRRNRRQLLVSRRLSTVQFPQPVCVAHDKDATKIYGSAGGSVPRLYPPLDKWAVQIPEPHMLAFCLFVSSHRIHQKVSKKSTKQRKW